MSPFAFLAPAPLATTSVVRTTSICPCRPASVGVTMMADEKAKNPLGGLGGLGNIMDAFKKAQEFTSVAKDLQEQLRNTEIEASVRDGAVKVTMNAQQVPIKIEVSDELVAQGSKEVRHHLNSCAVSALCFVLIRF